MIYSGCPPSKVIIRKQFITFREHIDDKIPILRKMHLKDQGKQPKNSISYHDLIKNSGIYMRAVEKKPFTHADGYDTL